MKSVDANSRYLNLDKPPRTGLDNEGVTKVLEQLHKRMEIGRKRFPEVLVEIQNLLHEVDPLALLAQVSVFDSLRRHSVSAAVTFGSDASIEFLAGLITAMDPDCVLSRLGMDFHPGFVPKIDRLLMALANYQNDLRLGEQLTSGDRSDVGLAGLLLSMESNFDRTEGYQWHIEEIVSHILAPLAKIGTDIFGFPPAISIELARAQSSRSDAKYNKIREEIWESFHSLTTTEQAEWKRRKGFTTATEIRFGASELEPDLVGSLVEMTGIPIEFVANALNHLCTELGSQIPVTRFDQPLNIQNRPVIRIPDGRMMWFRPMDFAHEALNWFHELSKTDSKVELAFNNSRQRETPKMVGRLLERVFDSSNVHLEPTYDSGGRPDADILVSVPSAAIIVEVKGLHFTQIGRQGRIDRVKTKHYELVVHPIDQLNRAENSLSEYPISWRDSKGRHLGLSKPQEILKMIVTLENIEPLCAWHQTKNKRSGVIGELVWPVSLSDLMMVADILRTPSELYAYVAARSRIFAMGNPIVGMETDALALWCRERFIDEGTLDSPQRILDFQSDELNDFFTMPSSAVVTNAPNSSIPAIVSDSLTHLYRKRDPDWLFLSLKITAITPSQWKPFLMALDAEFATKKSSKRAERLSRKLVSGILLGGHISICVGTPLSPPNPSSNMCPIQLSILTDGNGQMIHCEWNRK